MIRKLFYYVYKHLYPISYAKHIGVKIGKNCRLINVSFGSEPYLVKLGDYVSATKVQFVTHDGGVWVFRRKFPNIDVIKPITVGNNVFIGIDTIIMPGVNIGDNIVIGAGSLVSKNLDSNFVYAGNPVKKIKSLDEYFSKIDKSKINTKSLSVKKKKEFLINYFQSNKEDKYN